MIRLIAIGLVNDYDSVANSLHWEYEKGNINLCGLYIPGQFYARNIDKIPLLTEEELVMAEFDYLLVFSDVLMPLTIQLCTLLGRTRKVILPSRILSIPGFDFKKYLEIYNSNISIVCNHCWGGFLYHTLGMELSSPFINVFFSAADYIKLISDIDTHLDKTLVYRRNEFDKNSKVNYPVMALGDVELHFNHCTCPEEASEMYYRRMQRFNSENIVYECLLDTPENAEHFADIPFARKLGFAPFEYDHPNIIDIRKVNGFYSPNDGPFFAFVNSQASLSRLFHLFNVFDFLLGNPDYMRIE